MKWRVKYFCTCRETRDSEVPETLHDARCFHELNYLYFCEDCAAVRCNYCVDKEVASIFCPSCLFEATQTSAIANGNVCLRNCLRCPDCVTNLVVSSTDAGYTARCAQCGYSIELAKGRSLALQVEDTAENERIERLKRAFVDGKEIEAEPANPRKLPLRVPLRARYAKFCKYCRNKVVDPDPQPGSAKIVNAVMARSMVPEIRILAKADQPQLAVFNPTPLELQVSLASKSDVRFLATQLTLKPGSAKRDDLSLIRGVPECLVGRETTASRQVFMEGSRKKQAGVQKGLSWALIDLEVPSDLDEFNVQVSVKFIAGNETMSLTLWLRCQKHKVD